MYAFLNSPNFEKQQGDRNFIHIHTLVTPKSKTKYLSYILNIFHKNTRTRIPL